MRLLFALPFLLLAGCSGGASESDLVGPWTGKAGMTYEAMQKDASGESEQAEFLAAQEGSGKTITLDLQAGGKAVFTNDQPIEGTWKLEGDTVVLTLPERQSPSGGPAFSGTYRLKLKGKDTLSGPDPQVEGFSLTFSR
jgi:hypothetical protein